MNTNENGPSGSSTKEPAPVQDLIAIPTGEHTTHYDVDFHENGTADVTVHNGPGTIEFHPGIIVANPTRIARKERHYVSPPEKTPG